MIRIVEPEILETLHPEDPAALVSRANLRLVNSLMGNHRWLVRQALHHGRRGWRILELGAGDGALGRHLVNAGACRPQDLTGIDLMRRPALWPSGAHWLQGDMLVPEGLPEAEIVLCNMILHHLQPEALRLLGERLRPTCRLLLACEPVRRQLHLFQGRVLQFFVPLNHVTRHDLRASVRAGFQGDELLETLDLKPRWSRAFRTWLGAYRVIALQPERAPILPPQRELAA